MAKKARIQNWITGTHKLLGVDVVAFELLRKSTFRTFIEPTTATVVNLDGRIVAFIKDKLGGFRSSCKVQEVFNITLAHSIELDVHVTHSHTGSFDGYVIKDSERKHKILTVGTSYEIGNYTLYSMSYNRELLNIAMNHLGLRNQSAGRWWFN